MTGAAIAPWAERPPIAVLPPEVAARIAAGEVIERPASLLKELVENALDAGARRIEVELEGGGIERLRVRDDGAGIPPEQIADAFERHATSKLRTERDLFAVRTLGFRGEALAAIAAAADVDLTSRPPGQEAAAVARYRGGRPDGQGSAAAAPGTSVEVRDLFAALPARRRFLRGARAEARACARILQELALARPEVAVRLRSEGRSLLATPGSGALADAVAAVHGAEAAAALLAVEGGRRGERSDADAGAGAEAEVAAVTVSGAVAAPSLHRASRRALLVVANGRVIRAGSLGHAIERAYEGLLPRGRHPLAFVRVEVPPDQIDVNVHPAKAEVRFRHERFVYAAVRDVVREAVLRAPAAAAPQPVAPAAGPAARPSAGAEGAAAAPPRLAARAVLSGARAAPAALDVERYVPLDGDGDGDDSGGGGDGARRERARQGALPLRERLPALRALGQLGLTYVAAEAPDGLYLVDQHAAHERVQYERLLRSRRAGEAQSQPLLEPVMVSPGASRAALAAERADELTAVGWELTATDGAALMLRAMPALLATEREDPGAALLAYLDRLEADRPPAEGDRAVAALACHAAVRAGDRMEEQQQRALLRALERCPSPLTCPHGRPTVLHLGTVEIERAFGRR